MQCGDENALVGYADGLLSGERAASVVAHLDGCAECRAVVAGLARTEASDALAREAPAPARTPAASPAGPPRSPSSAATTRPLSTAPPRGAVPLDLMRAYLHRDAPEREMAVARFWFGVTGLSIPALLALQFIAPPPIEKSTFGIAGAAILGALLVYELGIYVALRRGWFHRAVPWVSTCIETSSFFAMHVAVMKFQPPEAQLGSPGPILWSAYLMFVAIRAEPRICVLGGVLAAMESVALGLFGAPFEGGPPAVMIYGVRGSFLLVAGLGGAAVARYLIKRAEQALHEAREQDLLGKYVLHERLGRGGMGEVFRASYCPEGGFTRPVAIKRVRAELSGDPRFEEVFLREARLCASLTHPNLVQVLDCGKFRGQFVLAMEYVDGISLARLISRASPLPLAAVTYLGAELAAALDYIHRKRSPDGAPLGLVHCDVNPPNVLLSRIGEVKLGDFGVARAGTTQPDPFEGKFAGKLTYAAPEQLAMHDLDGRVDLYALGLTLYEALTGRAPVHEATTPGALPSVMAPSRLRADVPASLDRIVLDLLARDPGARPQSAEQVRVYFCALGGPLAPYPDGDTQLAAAVEHALTSSSAKS